MGEAFWRQTIEQQQVSGLSVGEFCADQKLALSTFQKWKQRLGSDRATFSEVRLEREAVVDAAGVEIRLPCGTVIRCVGAIVEAQLSSVLRAVRAS